MLYPNTTTRICSLQISISESLTLTVIGIYMPSACRAQISSVSSFATQRGVMLSTEKCEAIISPSVPANKSYIQADAIKIPISHSARCLGAWWTPNLSSSKWITVNINKARGAFFSRGSGTFHGTLNPLSSRSIIECCVFTVPKTCYTTVSLASYS